MKKISLQKPKIKLNLKAKVVLWAVILSILGLLTFRVIKAVNGFFNANYLQFNRIIEIKVNKPIEIRKREENIKYIELLDYPDEIDTPLEIYICETFGQYDCKTALAIAKAESGLREDAIGINVNSIDIGVFQINSTHLKRCPLKQLADAEGNVDCAYEIFQEQGWNPWTVYKQKTYLNHY